ncbi:DUF1549 domain-containing protein [Crateriforma conspicua]|uniref:Bacterial Ig-like domain (Group 2) n=1 Tax=Crateriforma conspicua TaxID=2527996 RepID=A0A5C5Y585_9PLAN|nr:DUF1549 domain-containing protein [Crateriforma conspicua]TWT70069.1 hypothetical protein Pan14r_23670 [Crateriforma conspicua]
MSSGIFLGRSIRTWTHRCVAMVAALAVTWASVAAHAVTPDPDPSASRPSKPPRPALEVYPPNVQLDSARDYQSFVAVLRRPDGITVDVTDQVRWSVGDDAVARVDGVRVVPIADGKTELVGRFSGHHFKVPVTVKDASVKPAISFGKDVMPVLTRSGCNTGSCHGAARGKDGFRLSLFGFDPDGDYHRITREMGVRRVNLAVPAESLMLRKAIGAVPHTGGKLFDVDSPYYATMLEWLQDGAPEDPSDAKPPAVESLAVYPQQAVIEGTGTKQRFVAVATYEDGTTRDVTNLSAFSSNNSGSADIDGTGTVTAGSRGEAFVMARFDTKTVGSQVLTLPEGLVYEPPQQSARGEDQYIDQLVDKKLHQLRITPSGQCSDEEFIRRVTIDVIGLLPTEDEFHQFVNDPSENKRAELIDRLLARKEFSEIWAMKFAQLLMIKSTDQVSYKSAFLYSKWLTEQFQNSVPVDQMVHELLTSTGGTFSQPATNFYEIERDQLKTSENVAQVFLGIRTQCAQCHNHPFDRWTMDDYYGFAAFFSQIGRKQAEDYREKIIYNRGSGTTKHPVTGATVEPKFLGGEAPETRGKDRRQVLADWLTAPENPYFAKSIANRVWAHFMGVGLVDEVDDIRVSNPPSNPELFDTLGEKLVAYDFDFRALVRDICNSDAYQRSCQINESNQHDNRNYAHAVIRRIPAENMLDCLSQVTDSPDKFRGLPLGARAVQIADGTTSNYFLTTFGRSPRATVCECEASTDPSLSQALHLLNGNSVQGKIASGKLIRTWLKEEKLSPEQILDRLYVRSLSRVPTKEERDDLLAMVNEQSNAEAVLQDVAWAILNSREFAFNH